MKNINNPEKTERRTKPGNQNEQERSDKPEKKDDTFIYAAILFGSLILGAIVLILKMFGLF